MVIETSGEKKTAKQIVYVKDGQEQTIDLVEDDLVFITNGCCTDTSCYGDQTHAPNLDKVKNGSGESWDLWKNIAAQAQHGEFGNPDNFCGNVEETNWMSATIATSDETVIRHIMKICQRDPRAGKVTTGGIVTVKDSVDNWYLSWTINRQPQFKSQDRNMVLDMGIWPYHQQGGQLCKEKYAGLHRGRDLQRVAVSHRCSGSEDRGSGKNACNTTTAYMPFITAFSSQERMRTGLRLCRRAQSTLLLWGSLQRLPEIRFLPLSILCVPVWNLCTRFLMWIVACRKYGEANTM